jgi:TetR/AcrR family transcriptional regulator, regulator of cefoperazone and chloramphenicol sensitivity
MSPMRRRERRPRRGGRPARHTARASADVAETRARLLDAARRLFAERGFADVTVREICREAGANLALVNYYFGDKLGLYLEVVNEAIASLRDFNSLAMTAPEGSGAEERLRLFVRGLLHRVFELRGVDSWVHRLVQHELSRPTELAKHILQEAMAPRIRYLADIVAELLACPKKDPRVMHCVASVHGLCLVYSRIVLASQFKAAMPDLASDGPLDVENAVAHVSAFSLAGIRAMRR